MKKRVFVYGSLKRGQEHHRLLTGQVFLGAASTAAGYRLFDLGGYPGMVRAGEDGLSIAGEVWEVDEGCLWRLDELEDTASGEYERVEIDLLPPFADRGVEGYLYLRPVAGCRDAGSSWP